MDSDMYLKTMVQTEYNKTHFGCHKVNVELSTITSLKPSKPPTFKQCNAN